jgi:tetratricopeptide (TPR) repeat protein
LIGIGGSGKTTLATWAALQAHERGIFHYIVSITAKDRELTTDGIKSLSASSTTYENLLDGIADVLGFPEYVGRDINEQEVEIRSLLENSNGLLYVDNLETVDDPRVIQFLDDLPVGVKALITSRRQAVRVAVRPIDVGPLTEDEARLLVRSLEPEPGFGYIAQLHDPEIDQITESCDRLPLAIRWTLARAGSATEAMYRADALPESKGKSDGQLLEFVFRRVFDAMSDCERAVMQILSIFQDPSSAEAVVTGAGHPGHLVMDALDDLTRDALSQRLYDEDRNDYVYALAPLTRSFVLGELQRRPEVEKRIRKRLSEWYEAKDIKNLDERLIIREIRQGRGSSDDALVDLAQAAQKRGDLRTAQEMYENALKRNPNSWRAARLCAEFERHVNRDTTRALQLYEQAAANAPRHGHDRALIHRELGMLLRDSGRVDATDAAIEKFEIARQETPNDAALNHALAVMYTRKGMYMKVITLLEPLRSHPSPKTREMALHELVKAYEKTTNILEAAEAKQELAELRTKGQPR